MADDYDETVARFPRKKLSGKESAQARYGSKLDEQRHVSRQALRRWAQWIGAAAAFAVAITQLFKFWQGG